MSFDYKTYKKIRTTTYVISALNVLLVFAFAYFKYLPVDNPRTQAAIAVQIGVIVLYGELYIIYAKNEDILDKKIKIYPLIAAVIAAAVIVDMTVFPWIPEGEMMISYLHSAGSETVVAMVQELFAFRPAWIFYNQSRLIYTRPKNELQEDGSWKHNEDM